MQDVQTRTQALGKHESANNQQQTLRSGGRSPHTQEDENEQSGFVNRCDLDIGSIKEFAQSKHKRHTRGKRGKKRARKDVEHGFFSSARESVTAASQGVEAVSDIIKQLDKIKQTLQYKETDKNDIFGNLLSRVEDFILYILNIAYCDTWQSVALSTALYIKTVIRGPMLPLILEHVNSLFATVADSDKEQGALDHGVGDVFGKWKSVRKSALTKNLINVLNILISVGILPEDKYAVIKCGEFKIFEAKLWNKQSNALDFFEMLMDTMTFFLERGYHALLTGDWSVLLYDDDRMHELDTEYALLLSAIPMLETGRLHDIKDLDGIKDEDELDLRCEKLIAVVKAMMRQEKGPVRQILANKLVILQKLQNTIILLRKKSCIREKPFGVLIYGGSSVGKSCVNAHVIKTLLAANGFSSTSEYSVTMNESDAFHSELRGFHNAVTFDDCCNTQAQWVKTIPSVNMTDFLNNVPKAALNPEADKKGQIMIEPKVVTVTTNVKDLMAGIFSNEPVSVIRRFNAVLDVKLKPDCVDPMTGSLKASLMNVPVPDVWDIRLQVVKIVRADTQKKADSKKLMKDSWRFIDVFDKPVSLQKCIWTLVEMSKLHFAQQQKFVNSVEDLFSVSVCASGSLHCDGATCAMCVDESARSSVCRSLSKVMDTEQGSSDVLDFNSRELVFETAEYEKSGKSFKSLLQDKIAHTMEMYPHIVTALGMISVALVAVKMYQHMNVEEQDGPRLPQLLETDVPNPWKQVEPLGVECPGSVNTAYKDLVAMVERNIGHITFVTEDGAESRCNAFPVGRNCWLVPNHMLLVNPVRARIRTTPRDKLGKNADFTIDPSKWCHIPNTDYTVVSITAMGDCRDLLPFFPEKPIKGFTGQTTHVVYRDGEGQLSTHKAVLRCQETVKLKHTYEAIRCVYDVNTFNGMCMATHVLESRRPIILGCHLAGLTGTTSGLVGVITRPQIQSAIDELNRSCFVSHSSTPLTNNFCGEQIEVSNKVDRHCSQWLADDPVTGQPPNVVVVGQHAKGRVTFRSKVKTSLISESVARCMHLQPLHGPPNTQQAWRHYSRHLTAVTHTPCVYDPQIMKQARDDVQELFESVMTDHWKKQIHVLDDDANLAGFDGITSIDRVDLQTSMGWPWNKAKTHFITESEREVPGISQPLDLDPSVMKVIEEFEEQLSRGERINAVHRANLKDEAIKFTKTKVRVFSGCTFPLVFLTRKYFLTLVRFIQSNNVDLECAIGMNAHGPQWDEFASKFIEFGEEFFDGDFSDYDLKMSADMTSEVWMLLIRLAEKCGYSQRSLRIMRGIVTEIIYPLMEHDGVLLYFFGSNTSGHSLTVIVNGIANMFFIRLAWYGLIRRNALQHMNFRDFVRLVTYGDDNILAIKRIVASWFNRRTVSEELARMGVTYTGASKGDVIEPVSPIENITFLKRGFRYDQEIGAYMAPLDVNSISKSLHCMRENTKCLLTPRQLGSQALMAAAREFFQHGREVYDQRCVEMLQVVKECDLPGVRFNTFDDCVKLYRSEPIGAAIVGEYEEQGSVGMSLDRYTQSYNENFSDDTETWVTPFSPRVWPVVEFDGEIVPDDSAVYESCSDDEVEPDDPSIEEHENALFEQLNVRGVMREVAMAFRYNPLYTVFLQRIPCSHRPDKNWTTRMLAPFEQISDPRATSTICETYTLQGTIGKLHLVDNHYLTIGPEEMRLARRTPDRESADAFSWAVHLFIARHDRQRIAGERVYIPMQYVASWSVYSTTRLGMLLFCWSLIEYSSGAGPSQVLFAQAYDGVPYNPEVHVSGLERCDHLQCHGWRWDIVSGLLRFAAFMVAWNGLRVVFGYDWPGVIRFVWGFTAVWNGLFLAIISLFYNWPGCVFVPGIILSTNALVIHRDKWPWLQDLTRYRLVRICLLWHVYTMPVHVAFNLCLMMLLTLSPEALGRLEMHPSGSSSSSVKRSKLAHNMVTRNYAFVICVVLWLLCVSTVQADAVFTAGIAVHSHQTLHRHEPSGGLSKRLTDTTNITIQERHDDDRANVVSFNAQAREWDYIVPTNADETFRTADDAISDLDNFFMRPVEVYRGAWPVAADFNDVFNPWYEYLANKRVMNRINNYKIMRCKLCIKFVINGNGFYAGRVLVDYTPLHNQDSFGRNGASTPIDAVRASQRPHLWLDPTTSKGGDLCMPFLWPHNGVDLTRSEFGELGYIHLRSVVNLTHASGGTNPITITAFAWAENMVLSVPTSKNIPALVPQGDVEQGDTKEPTLSKAATNVAGVADALSRYPSIAPYAMASKMVANMVATIASSMGFSRSLRYDTDTIMRPNPFGVLAPANQSDLCDKLTIDAQQEVCVDPRVVGLGDTDEMMLGSICSRESYLTGFEFNLADLPGDLLWQCYVTPSMFRIEPTAGAPSGLHMTACCAASTPFRWWRGTMRYRFQVVGNAFNKGRLRFVWDPSGDTTGEWNTNYTHVVDLTDQRDFCIDIGWGQSENFLETLVVRDASSGSLDEPFNSGPVPLPPRPDTNGVLSVYVVNELTTSSNVVQTSVFTLVSVSALPDILLQEPDDFRFGSLKVFDVPDGGDNTEADVAPPLDEEQGDSGPNDLQTANYGPPVSDNVVAVFGVPPDNSKINQVLFGETITSVRQVCKRYCTTSVAPLSATNGASGKGVYINTFADYPAYTGYNPFGYDTRGGNPCVFGATSFIHYFTPMFVCRRGGLRHKLFIGKTTNSSVAGTIDQVIVERVPMATQESNSWFTNADPNWTAAAALQGIGSGGTVCDIGLTRVVNYETPYYTNKRFYLARIADVAHLSSFDPLGQANNFHGVYCTKPSTVPDTQLVFSRYIAGADDFSLHFWIGPPIMYHDNIFSA